MAEGCYVSRKLEGGSEAPIDQACTQCRAYGSTQEATEFCQDCKQFLCNICGRRHGKYMKTHTLVSAASTNPLKTLLPTDSPVKVAAKCQYHPDHDIEMFCGTHDMVYCCRCIASEHRSCSDVKMIGGVVHKCNLSTLQSLVADITRVSKQLHSTKLKMSNDHKLIQNKKDSLLEEIKALRKQFNEHLDALEQEIIAELDEQNNKLKKEIGDAIRTVDDLIIAFDKCKPDLMSHFDEKQIFIAEKLGEVVLADANNFLKKSDLLKHPTLKFEPNDILSDAVGKSERMGKINRIDTKQKQTQRSSYTVKCMKAINVKVRSDKEMCCINDMRQLPDGSILLIDKLNDTLKRLDDQIKVKGLLKFDANPMGLCSVSPTEVAVRLNDGTIHFIYAGKSLEYERSIYVNDFSKGNDGMVCCNNQLWIPGNKAVYVRSILGTLVKKIETDSEGRNIFPKCNPQDTVVSDDDTRVYVTAWNDRVVVFDNNGDVIKELRDQRLDGAYSICITDDDIVLVAGYKSKNVVMFDRYGSSLGELIPSQDMLSEPRSLCYDRERCRLLVGYGLNEAQIFQLG